MSSIIKCSECMSVFTEKKNLYAHMRKRHDLKPTFAWNNKKKIECPICSKLFSSKYTLNRHMINYHKRENHHNYSKTSRTTSRLLCPQDDCTEKLPNYRALQVHLNENHSIDIETEKIEFNSVNDFEIWKNEVQLQTLSCYTLDTAAKRLSDKVKKQYFNCHRSYTYKPKGKNIRSLKSTGSNKIGKACPSRMTVTTTTEGHHESVKVEFCKTHCGHEIELGHVPLDKQSRTEIAGKLKKGVPFNHILESLRANESNQSDTNRRRALIERKDLHNIVRDYKIDYSTKRHQNDADDLLDLLDMCQDTTADEVHPNEEIIQKAEDIIELSSNSSISEEDSRKIKRYLDNVISLLKKTDTVSLETKKKEIKSSNFEEPPFAETITVINEESGEVYNINIR